MAAVGGEPRALVFQVAVDTEGARAFCRFFQVGMRLLPQLGWLVGVA
jgi:hypothetical protein